MPAGGQWLGKVLQSRRVDGNNKIIIFIFVTSQLAK